MQDWCSDGYDAGLEIFDGVYPATRFGRWYSNDTVPAITSSEDLLNVTFISLYMNEITPPPYRGFHASWNFVSTVTVIDRHHLSNDLIDMGLSHFRGAVLGVVQVVFAYRHMYIVFSFQADEQ